MTATFQGFHIRHEPGDPGAAPLLLLHGTGGDEHDLIEFGRLLAPRSPLLGVRGQEREGPVNRWFRRFGEGVFDLPNLEARQGELKAFVAAASGHFGFARKPVAIGYSNGANIAAAMLMRSGADVLSGAVLMRSMAGLDPAPDLDLRDLPVLMLDGAYDPLAPTAAKLEAQLRGANAQVIRRISGPGHAVDRRDAELAREWLVGLPALTP